MKEHDVNADVSQNEKEEKTPREIEEEKAEEIAKEVVHYAKCGECGAVLPVEQMADNGNYIVCPKCL